MAEDIVNVNNQPSGAGVSVVKSKSINGAAVTIRYVERVIASRSIGQDVDGDDLVVDIDVGTDKVATTKVNAAFSATDLLGAARANRRSIKIVNDSPFDLVLRLGAAADADNWFWKIFAGEQYEMPNPVFTGTISGFWIDPGGGTISGKARITEQW